MQVRRAILRLEQLDGLASDPRGKQQIELSLRQLLPLGHTGRAIAEQHMYIKSQSCQEALDFL